MRINWILFIAVVTLVGCAKGTDAPVDVTCEADVEPHEVYYPDLQIRKSKVSSCSNGCTQYESVENDDASFSDCD